MAKQAPVTYPNLVDQIKAVTQTHVGIHEAVRTHVQEHHSKLEAQRKALHVKQIAKKLIEEDGKP